MKIGDKVTITGNTNGHGFQIGEDVKLVQFNKDNITAKNSMGLGWDILEGDYRPIDTIIKMKAEELQHEDGRKVVMFERLPISINSETHLLQYDDGCINYWNESDTWLIPIKKQRWQGIYINLDGAIGSCISKYFTSSEELFNHYSDIGIINAAYNLDTKEIKMKP